MPLNSYSASQSREGTGMWTPVHVQITQSLHCPETSLAKCKMVFFSDLADMLKDAADAVEFLEVLIPGAAGCAT